jgi:hypothetical protein
MNLSFQRPGWEWRSTEGEVNCLGFKTTAFKSLHELDTPETSHKPLNLACCSLTQIGIGLMLYLAFGVGI